MPNLVLTEGLRHLVAEGLTNQEIADRLSIAPAEVARQRAHLPSADEAPWTEKEDLLLADLRNRRGFLWTTIGRHIHRDPESCRARYEVVMPRLLGRKAQGPSRVRCLGYGPTHYFISSDRTKYRICPDCKAAQNGLPDHHASVEKGIVPYSPRSLSDSDREQRIPSIDEDGFSSLPITDMPE